MCNGEGKCPPCPPVECPGPVCECTARNGSLLVPVPSPQPTEPSDCPPCPVPSCAPIDCIPPNTPCTDLELETYVLLCPECVPQAGCQQVGCDCKDCFGNIFSPPINPTQSSRQFGCPECSTDCIVSDIKCGPPVRCTQDQINNYDRI